MRNSRRIPPPSYVADSDIPQLDIPNNPSQKGKENYENLLLDLYRDARITIFVALFISAPAFSILARSSNCWRMKID